MAEINVMLRRRLASAIALGTAALVGMTLLEPSAPAQAVGSTPGDYASEAFSDPW